MMKEDWNAYKEGQETSKRVKSNPDLAENPYLINTDSWYSWNKGWNSDLGCLKTYCDALQNLQE